jgi:restriction system protein
MPVGRNEWVAAAVVGVIVCVTLIRAIPVFVDWLFSDWKIPAATTAAILLGALTWSRWNSVALRRRTARLQNLRLSLEDIDVMSPVCFEWAVRDLMLRDGIRARHVGQRGDRAADVIGDDRGGHRIVVQCKHTGVGRKVGSRVVYEVNGTAGPAHGADIAVIVTNDGFTRDARKVAGEFGIHLVDRAGLERWATEGACLREVLRLTNPFRRRRRLRTRRP